MPKADYIKYNGSSKDTASMGWVIASGGRVANPPVPRRATLSDIPFRMGDLDIFHKVNGKHTYPNRTLSFTFVQSFQNVAEAVKGTAELTAWLSGCVGKDLTDTLGHCTFHNVSIDSIDEGAPGLKMTVKAAFTAAPMKTVDGEECL